MRSERSKSKSPQARPRAASEHARIHLRIHVGPALALGPGKADLLEGIAETGSIAAAGRRLGMSYKRAWVLIDEINTCFRTPLVSAAKGGATGGGAKLTGLGSKVLALYRRMQRQATQAVAADANQLRRWMSRSTPRN